MKCGLFAAGIFVMSQSVCAAGPDEVIFNGIPRFDDAGNVINAHGACIVEEGGRYYMFGEWKSDESNAFPGFSCYSSDDLVNWHFERVVLGVQKDGIMGPDRVGERVKVMKCPSTGEFVMYMHSDNMNYKDPQVGYATCSTINGEYEFQGPLLFEGEPIRRWDMGTFQDSDGTGYLLIHHGVIYRLSNDYKSAEAKVLSGLKDSGESPAMFHKDGTYYLLGSGLTGWERNDNFYFTAPAVEGPWTRRGCFAPEGSLTYNSQTTFVFPLKVGSDTVPMYMGDRWSYPRQASSATYVWLPLKAEDGSLSIPEYWESWNPVSVTKEEPFADAREVDYSKATFHKADAWKSDSCRYSCGEPGGYMEVPFSGGRIAIVGKSDHVSSYGKVSVIDSKGNIVVNSLVDFYSKVPAEGVRYVSPAFPEDDYTLRLEVSGITQEWITKKGIRYGSDGFNINIDRIHIL